MKLSTLVDRLRVIATETVDDPEVYITVVVGGIEHETTLVDVAACDRYELGVYKGIAAVQLLGPDV